MTAAFPAPVGDELLDHPDAGKRQVVADDRSSIGGQAIEQREDKVWQRVEQIDDSMHRLEEDPHKTMREEAGGK